MKKVLIVGYFWPYRNGSGRVIGLARYLSEFGWQPIILTGPLEQKPPSEFRFIETDYYCFLGSWIKLLGFNHKKDIGDQFKAKIEKKSSRFKGFLRGFYWLIQEVAAYPDENKNWPPFALKAGSELLEREKIEAIISIWPVTSHIIAEQLKKKYRIPWLADFPDLWSQNHNYHYTFLRRFFDRKLEKKTLASAEVLTTVTEPWKENLKKIHKEKIIYSIPHGFDPETAVLNKKIDLTPEFTITYTGQIYYKKQAPQKLITALKELIDCKVIDPAKVKVRFYGPFKSWLADEIKNAGLENIIKQYGIISKEMAFKKQKESQILLLFNWEDRKEKGVCPMKIYDYLATRRPVLATGGKGSDVVNKILSETGTGVYALEVEDIKLFIYLRRRENIWGTCLRVE